MYQKRARFLALLLGLSAVLTGCGSSGGDWVPGPNRHFDRQSHDDYRRTAYSAYLHFCQR